MKLMKRMTLLVFVLIISWVTVTVGTDNISEQNKVVVYTDIDVTHNDIAELSAANTSTENSHALATLLAYRKNNLQYQAVLRFPRGTFKLSALTAGAFELSNNTLIRMDEKTKIKLYGDVMFAGVPTGKGSKDGLSNFQWQGGQLIGNGKRNRAEFLIIHGQNLSIDNVKFVRVSAYNQHVFDLNGVHDMTISNSKFIGYGTGDLNKVPENSRYHASVAEAIQLDTANYKTSYGQHQRIAMRSLQPKLADYSSNIGNDLVNVMDNEFLPYTYKGKLITPAQSPIGTHAFKHAKEPTDQVVFARNTVSDVTVPTDIAGVGDNAYDNNYPAPLHFTGMRNVKIFENTFRTTNENNRQNSWISNYQNDERFSVENFIIEGNHFQGLLPTRSITLFKFSTSNTPDIGRGLVENIVVKENTFMPGVQILTKESGNNNEITALMIQNKNKLNTPKITLIQNEEK